MARTVAGALRQIQLRLDEAVKLTTDACVYTNVLQNKVNSLEAERDAGTVHWLCKSCGGDMTLKDAQVDHEKEKHTKLIGELAGIEWGDFEYDGVNYSKCPACSGVEPKHEDDCWLAAAITDVM